MEARIEESDSGPVTIPEEGNILIYKHAICLHLLMSILVRPSGYPARSSGVVNCPNMVLLPQKMFNIVVIAREFQRVLVGSCDTLIMQLLHRC